LASAPIRHRALGTTRIAWIHVALVAAILLPLLAVRPADAAMGRVVTAESLNIRACAALDCQVIGAAHLGDAIEIAGGIVNGFYPVRWFGQDGYAFAPYINPGNTAPWFVEGDVSCKRVALTFNIGIGYTPSQSVLNTLIQKETDATMFPMGWWVAAQPNYLRALDAAGFVIGTHCDERNNLTGLSDAGIRQDTLDSIAAIEAMIGRPIDPYHTPYAADTDNRVRTVVSNLGLLPVGWKVAAADYGSGVTSSFVYSRVMNGIYPGAIVEFHLDGPASAPSTGSGVINVLAESARVPVRGLPANGWVPVTCAGRAGRVFASYFRLESTVPPPNPTPTPTPTGTTYGTVSNTGGANLRCGSQASTASGIVALLAPGARVVVRGASANGWTPVVCAGQNGFVSSSYLVVQSGPSPTQPPTSSTFATVSNTGGDNLRCRTGPDRARGMRPLRSCPRKRASRSGARTRVAGCRSSAPARMDGHRGRTSPSGHERRRLTREESLP